MDSYGCTVDSKKLEYGCRVNFCWLPFVLLFWAQRTGLLRSFVWDQRAVIFQTFWLLLNGLSDSDQPPLKSGPLNLVCEIVPFHLVSIWGFDLSSQTRLRPGYREHEVRDLGV